MDDALRALVTGAAEQAPKIKDRLGNDHTLQPLTIEDVVAYEEHFGHTMSVGAVGYKDIFYMLYLSLRTEGLSEDQIEKRQWRYTERQVQKMFDLGLLKRINETLNDLLRISGLVVDKDKDANPPKAPSQ